LGKKLRTVVKYRDRLEGYMNCRHAASECQKNILFGGFNHTDELIGQLRINALENVIFL